MKDYFPESEFQRCDPPCKKSDMNADFMRMLNEARHLANVPFVLNSAYRSPEHEVKQGRKPDGPHTTGRAVDIKCTNSRMRHLITVNLYRVGFHRLGEYATFIHVDSSPNHPPAVKWRG